jgi:ABC-type spermidine/putrescine transport system permease subunit I
MANPVLCRAAAFPDRDHLLASPILPARTRVRDLCVAFLIVPIFSSYLLRIYACQVRLSPQFIINGVVGKLGIDPLPS